MLLFFFLTELYSIMERSTLEFNKMKKLVAIVNSRNVNQFQRLPICYDYEGIDYTVIHVEQLDALRTYDSDGYRNAFDVAFVPTYDVDVPVNYNLEQSVVYFHRFSKIHQQRKLTAFFNEGMGMSADYYLPLPAYPVDLDTFNYGNYSGEGVLKTVGGARSMGIMKFDTKKTNFRSFLTELKVLIDKRVDVNSAYVELCHAFGVEINCGKENTENEMATARFLNDSFMVQKLNPCHDVKELRVLKTLDEVVLYERSHFDNEDLNITNTFIHPDTYPKEELRKMFKEIHHVISRDSFPLLHGSIDVWYSEKDSQWGIYEYQSQYGHVFIPDDFHDAYLKRSIHKLCQFLAHQR